MVISLFQEEDDQAIVDDDPELTKRLNKQRKHAMSAVRGERRVVRSRNSYKFKGGRSSNNSKIQKQLGNW